MHFWGQQQLLGHVSITSFQSLWLKLNWLLQTTSKASHLQASPCILRVLPSAFSKFCSLRFCAAESREPYWWIREKVPALSWPDSEQLWVFWSLGIYQHKASADIWGEFSWLIYVRLFWWICGPFPLENKDQRIQPQNPLKISNHHLEASRPKSPLQGFALEDLGASRQTAQDDI